MNDYDAPAGRTGFGRKIALGRQLIKSLERYIRFYRKIMKPAPETPYGFKLYGSKAMQNGAFEAEETRLINKMLPLCDAFINIGANVGYYCCHALQQGLKVYAFEPQDLNLRYLLANIRENDWAGEVEVYPVALGASTGILEIYGAGTGASLIKGWAGSSPLDVSLASVMTLNNVLADRLSGKRPFILIDVEGAERFTLAGAEKFLEADPKPIWMVEISIDTSQIGGDGANQHLVETFGRFYDNGYRAWTANEQGREILPEEVQAIADGGEDTIGTNNFIFASPDLEESLPIGRKN